MRRVCKTNTGLFLASGLASQFPDYVLLVVDSTKGVEGMTREHIKIATALEVYYVCYKREPSSDNNG